MASPPINPAPTEPTADTPQIIEAVAVFQDEGTLLKAIDELALSGFAREDLSVMASQERVREKLAGRVTDVHQAIDDPETPRQPLTQPEERRIGQTALTGVLAYIGVVTALFISGGTLSPALLGAVAGGGIGGLLGAYLARQVGERHAREIQEHLDRGGLVLWVHVKDEARAATAKDILTRHSSEPVRFHQIPTLPNPA